MKGQLGRANLQVSTFGNCTSQNFWLYVPSIGSAPPDAGEGDETRFTRTFLSVVVAGRKREAGDGGPGCGFAAPGDGAADARERNETRRGHSGALVLISGEGCEQSKEAGSVVKSI